MTCVYVRKSPLHRNSTTNKTLFFVSIAYLAWNVGAGMINTKKEMVLFVVITFWLRESISAQHPCSYVGESLVLQVQLKDNRVKGQMEKHLVSFPEFWKTIMSMKYFLKWSFRVLCNWWEHNHCSRGIFSKNLFCLSFFFCRQAKECTCTISSIPQWGKMFVEAR